MSALLNNHTLSEAKDILGKISLKSSIRSAFHSLYKDLSLLENLDNGTDLESFASKVHRACGPCAIFGAAELLNQLSELEKQLRQNRTDSIRQMAITTRSIAEATEYELRYQIGGILERMFLTLLRKRR